MNKNDDQSPLNLSINNDLNLNYIIHSDNLQLIDAYLEKYGTFSEEQFINLCTLDIDSLKTKNHNFLNQLYNEVQTQKDKPRF